MFSSVKQFIFGAISRNCYDCLKTYSIEHFGFFTRITKIQTWSRQNRHGQQLLNILKRYKIICRLFLSLIIASVPVRCLWCQLTTGYSIESESDPARLASEDWCWPRTDLCPLHSPHYLSQSRPGIPPGCSLIGQTNLRSQ